MAQICLPRHCPSLWRGPSAVYLVYSRLILACSPSSRPYLHPGGRPVNVGARVVVGPVGSRSSCLAMLNVESYRASPTFMLCRPVRMVWSTSDASTTVVEPCCVPTQEHGSRRYDLDDLHASARCRPCTRVVQRLDKASSCKSVFQNHLNLQPLTADGYNALVRQLKNSEG